MEHDLEKKVAKFVPQVGKIAALDRVDDLVGFLQRVRCDRLEGLRQVPRTAAVRCPQRSHKVEKVLNVVRGSHKGEPLGRQQVIAASSADRHRVLRCVQPYPPLEIRIRYIMEPKYDAPEVGSLGFYYPEQKLAAP